MAQITGLTKERMLEIEAASIVSARKTNDNLILTTRGGTDINVGNVKGATGAQGPANTLTIGTVAQGAAAATITGTSPNQTLNLTIPKGDQGAQGPANTLTIGTVTQGTAGATITGISPNQTLNLTLPKGDKGDKGDSTIPVGGVIDYFGTTLPASGDWLFPNGSTYNTTTYPALYALLGTNVLPDMRKRVTVTLDATDTDYDTLGEIGGAKTVTLTTAQLPAHTHSIAHDHAAFTSGAEDAHTHSIAHDHAAFTSGAEDAHTHSYSATTTSTTAGGSISSTDTNHVHDASHNHSFQLRNQVNKYASGSTLNALHNSAGDWSSMFYVNTASYNTGYMNQNASHSHTFTGSAHTHSVSGTSAAGSSHSHSIDVPAYTGSSGAGSSHSHSIDVPAYTGDSGSTGSGSAVDIRQQYMVLNKLIRAR